MNKTNNLYRGKIIGINKKFAVVDLRLKAFYNLPIRECDDLMKEEKDLIGTELDLYAESLDPLSNRSMLVSYSKARFEIFWGLIEEAANKRSIIKARIIEAIRGGYNVVILQFGIQAFMPNSQAGFTGEELVNIENTECDVIIIGTNKVYKNVIVSHKDVIIQSLETENRVIISSIEIGNRIKGIVKGMTGYGVFIGLGFGYEGLMHINDASWCLNPDLNSLYYIGQIGEFIVKDVNHKNKRLVLSAKDLLPDPIDLVSIGDRLEVYPVKYVENTDFVTDQFILMTVNAEKTLICYITVDNLIIANINDIIKNREKISITIEKINKKDRIIIGTTKRNIEDVWQDLCERHQQQQITTFTVVGIGTHLLYVSYNKEFNTVLLATESDYINTAKKISSYSIGDSIDCLIIGIDTRTKNVLISRRAIYREEIRAIIKKLTKADYINCRYEYSLTKQRVVLSYDNEIEFINSKANLSAETLKKIEAAEKGETHDEIVFRAHLLERTDRSSHIEVSELSYISNPNRAKRIRTRGTTGSKRTTTTNLGEQYSETQVSINEVLGDQIRSMMEENS